MEKEIMDDRMYGKIKWYKPARNYGYIIGYDEEIYFFRTSGEEVFQSDEEVLFEPVEREDTLVAIRVEKVK